MIVLGYLTAAALIRSARRRERTLERRGHRLELTVLSHVEVVQ